MTQNETPTGDELTDRQLLALPFVAAASSRRGRADWIPAYAGMTVGYAKVSRSKVSRRRGWYWRFAFGRLPLSRSGRGAGRNPRARPRSLWYPYPKSPRRSSL